jgi:lysophospholipase L1-like esterase
MKTVLCYGDSNTYGAKPIDFDILDSPLIAGEMRFSRDERWTGILQKELEPDYFVIEEGLNGRTTSFDDPVEGFHRNGKTYLLPCLESHAPIDLVILMLGINDLKKRFSTPACDIALNIAALLDIITKSASGPRGKAPKILLMSQPPIGKLTCFSEMFEGSIEKSKKIALYYGKVAKLFNCHFFDTGKVIKTSDIDGLHFDLEEQKTLARAIAKIVKKIFE